MQIQFTGRNIAVTQALKDFTEEKMARLNHRDSKITKLDVTIHLENVTHVAEATVHTNYGPIHATAKADDMYAAIEMLADKLLTQVTKHKEKQDDHHRSN
jgi:putative sigma-54 modulation protein